MDTKQSLANVITEAVEACYPGVDGLPDASAIADMLEIPPQKEMGDYAFPCFKLSRALHMGPPRSPEIWREPFPPGTCAKPSSRAAT